MVSGDRLGPGRVFDSTSQTVTAHQHTECCWPQYSVPAVPPHTGRSVPSFVSDTSTASTQSQSSAIGSALPPDSRSLGTLVTEGKNLQEAAGRGNDRCVC